MVWRIVNHNQRLQSTGAPTDPKTGVPKDPKWIQESSPYIQFPVRPKNDEIILFKQQLDSLLSDAKKRPAWTTFWMFALRSFDNEIRFRGLFLSLTRQPASNTFLAELTGLTTVEIRKHLAILDKAGLIERVKWDDPALKPLPKSRRAGWRKEAREKAAKKAKKTTGKKAQKGGKTRAESPVPPGAVARGGTLQERQNGLTAFEEKNKSGLTALNGPPGGNEKGQSQSESRSAAPSEESQNAEGKYRIIQFPNGVTEIEDAQPKAETEMPKAETKPKTAAGRTAPTTTPPNNAVLPPIADAGEGCASSTPTSGQNFVSPPRSDMRWLTEKYGLQVSIWAMEVYEALGRPKAHDTRERIREVGVIASACSLDGYQTVHSKSLHHARGLAKHKPSFFKAGIVPAWRYVLLKRLKNAGGNAVA